MLVGVAMPFAMYHCPLYHLGVQVNSHPLLLSNCCFGHCRYWGFFSRYCCCSAIISVANWIAQMCAHLKLINSLDNSIELSCQTNLPTRILTVFALSFALFCLFFLHPLAFVFCLFFKVENPKSPKVFVIVVVGGDIFDLSCKWTQKSI